MTLLRRIDHWLFKSVSLLAQLFLIGAVAAGFWQVVARFVLSSPLDWSEVLTRALLIWAVLLGVVLAFRQGAMLGVQVLRSVLRARQRWVLEWLVALVCSGFLGFLAWIGAQMTWRVRFQTVPSLDVSISWIYLAIPVGAALAALAVLLRLAVEHAPASDARHNEG
ncbi:MAG: TRAP transporter small permease [Thauera sp.]|jgi:TRAP-type C4-dicarboxylate transport system permease small subunit